MRRATITLPDELEEQLHAYLESEEPRPTITAVVQTALERFFRDKALEKREYRPARGPLRITPAPRGSGKGDVSAEHDRYLADPPE